MYSELGFPGGSDSKESTCSKGDLGLIHESGRSPGRGQGNPLQCSCLENPWTEEPGGLQSMGSHRVRHDWVIMHILSVFGCFLFYWHLAWTWTSFVVTPWATCSTSGGDFVCLYSSSPTSASAKRADWLPGSKPLLYPSYIDKEPCQTNSNTS